MFFYPDLSNEYFDEVLNLNYNKMSLSIELAEKMLIRFDGTKSKLHDFIDNCDSAIKLVKTECKDILFAIIVSKITDNAKAMIRNRDFKKWQDLKTYLLEIYSEKRTIGQRQLELTSCKQNPGENVISYANKIENCYIQLINALDTELPPVAREACVNLLKNEALNVFITGLNKDLNILVKSQTPNTLEKAISIALNEEQELKSKLEIHKYQAVNNSSAKLCFNCNKPGHTTINCRFQRNSYHFSRNQPNIRHFSQNTKFCRYCKKSGHLIEECRKREFNNKMKQNQNNRFQNQNSRPPNQSNFSNNTRDKGSQGNSELPNLQNLSLNSQGPRQSTAITRGVHKVEAESQ